MTQRTGPRWSKQEDETLERLIRCHGTSKVSWSLIARDFEFLLRGDHAYGITEEVCKRTAQMCENRWNQVNAGITRGPWTEDEDYILINCMNQGITKWSEVSRRIPGRGGKQCRERWANHLDPSLKKTAWTAEEDWRLENLHKEIGNSWKRIAALMTGRSENEVKNRKNSAAHKRVIGCASEAPINTFDPKLISVPTRRKHTAYGDITEKNGDDDDDDQEVHHYDDESDLIRHGKRRRLCDSAEEESNRDGTTNRLTLNELDNDDFISLRFAEMALESHRAARQADSRAFLDEWRGPRIAESRETASPWFRMPSPTASIQWCELSRQSPTIDFARLAEMGFFSSMGSPELSRTPSPLSALSFLTSPSPINSDMGDMPTHTSGTQSMSALAKALATLEFVVDNDTMTFDCNETSDAEVALESFTSFMGLSKGAYEARASRTSSTRSTSSSTTPQVM